MKEEPVPSTLLMTDEEISTPDGEEPGCLSSSFHKTGLSSMSTLERPSLSFLIKGAPLLITLSYSPPRFLPQHLPLSDTILFVYVHIFCPLNQKLSSMRLGHLLTCSSLNESLLSKTCDTQKYHVIHRRCSINPC